MANNLKVGDVVQLKHGGPIMTVTEVATSNGKLMVWTVWFDGAKEVTGHYPVDAVEIFDITDGKG